MRRETYRSCERLENKENNEDKGDWNKHIANSRLPKDIIGYGRWSICVWEKESATVRIENEYFEFGKQVDKSNR